MTKDDLPVISEQDLLKMDIYRSYKNSKYLSIKISSYFQVYEELFSRFRHKKIVFVEIGVLEGGSLFMWRDYFGPEARIIGVEFNPSAKKWEKEGFEIYIGSQSDPEFWKCFFASVGDVDVILDDGGHTNEQQILTANCCIPHIKDGGMLVTEDIHTSYGYFKGFGNPSRYSFINYAKSLIDSINSRSPYVQASRNTLNRAVYSIGFYESIACFNVDRKKCFLGELTSNNGIMTDADDYRMHDTFSSNLSASLTRLFGKIGIKFSAKRFLNFFEMRLKNRLLKRYFR